MKNQLKQVWYFTKFYLMKTMTIREFAPNEMHIRITKETTVATARYLGRTGRSQYSLGTKGKQLGQLSRTKWRVEFILPQIWKSQFSCRWYSLPKQFVVLWCLQRYLKLMSKKEAKVCFYSTLIVLKTRTQVGRQVGRQTLLKDKLALKQLPISERYTINFHPLIRNPRAWVT